MIFHRFIRHPALLALSLGLSAGCATRQQIDVVDGSVMEVRKSDEQRQREVAQLQVQVAGLQDALQQRQADEVQLQNTATKLQSRLVELQDEVDYLQSRVTQYQGTVATAIAGTAKIDLQDTVDDHTGDGNQPPRELYVVPAGKYAEVRVLSLERSDPKLNFVLQLGTSGYYSYGAIIRNAGQPNPLPIAGMKITSYGTPIILDAGQKIMCQIVNDETEKRSLTYHILISEHPLSGTL
ncbi:MAG TPA: hypothetical protein VHC95_10130 [Opitutales bacterium]|nr:hypothetical protein [Opitutales bacterium]